MIDLTPFPLLISPRPSPSKIYRRSLGIAERGRPHPLAFSFRFCGPLLQLLDYDTSIVIFIVNHGTRAYTALERRLCFSLLPSPPMIKYSFDDSARCSHTRYLYLLLYLCLAYFSFRTGLFFALRSKASSIFRALVMNCCITLPYSGSTHRCCRCCRYSRQCTNILDLSTDYFFFGANGLRIPFFIPLFTLLSWLSLGTTMS